jgi:hypothetical protein
MYAFEKERPKEENEIKILQQNIKTDQKKRQVYHKTNILEV